MALVADILAGKVTAGADRPNSLELRVRRLEHLVDRLVGEVRDDLHTELVALRGELTTYTDREVARVHVRIDRVHARALRAVTSLLNERRQQ